MILLGRNHLSDFCRKSHDLKSRSRVLLWSADISAAKWKKEEDVLELYPRTSFISRGLVMFNFDEPALRITAQIAFETSLVIVLAVAISEPIGAN